VFTDIATRRLHAEINDLLENPVEGCETMPRDDDIMIWTAVMDGPPGSFYEGGVFFLQLNFDESYPFEAPKVSYFNALK
jgi:ubiquitin-conjugating enzyme E2 D/E